MAEKGDKPPVNGEAEKAKEGTELLQKRFDEVEREKARLSKLLEIETKRAEMGDQKVVIYKEQLDDVSEQLKNEKKRGVESRKREAVLQGEKEMMKEEVEGLKGENEVLKGEKENMKIENVGLKGEVVGLRSALEECENEKEELKRRLREMEEAKESPKSLIDPKEEAEDESQLIHRDNQTFDLDFMEAELIYETDFNEEEKPNGEMHIKEEEIFNENLDELGDDVNFKEEETPNDDVNCGMGDADLAMDNSSIDPSNDMQELSDGRGSTLEDENSLNDLSSNFEDVKGIDQFENSLETGDIERKRRSSRISSKPVKYSDSMENSDEDGKPSVKKSKSESGKRNEIKRQSSKKGQEISATGKNAKKNDKDLDCIECEYHTKSVVAFYQHLTHKHNTNFILAGLALLCDCGHESHSKKHSYDCAIANFTIVRKSNEPIQRLNDVKVTPQCVLCETYPKTAYGYAHHLRTHHKSALKESGIYLTCSCGHEIRYERCLNHSKECDGRRFTLHNLKEK